MNKIRSPASYTCKRLCLFCREKFCKAVYSGIELICEFAKQCLIITKIKLTAFADDLTTFLQGIQAFERLSITLDRFGICSGLKLNTEKTEALWLGKYHDNPHTSTLRKSTNL